MAVVFTPGEIRQKYDQAAAWYDRVEGILEILGIGRLRRELLRRAPGEALEVAAGTGKSFQHYPRMRRITAVDLSPGMLRVARRRASRLKLEVAFLGADAEALPFPDRRFDTVVSCLSVCTFPDPVAALREMARVCRADGRMLFLEHGRSDRERIGRWQDRHADGHARHLGCHWNRAPLDLVRQAGVTVTVARRTLWGIFHVIEARPGPRP
ncbi:MAG: class I SAM-dependent methyltransferase [Candidatus Latescibacteria bacterium]|nr:class I SAM-dependent methyltransferase [Candidatus Latescibacterota bacterium]